MIDFLQISPNILRRVECVAVSAVALANGLPENKEEKKTSTVNFDVIRMRYSISLTNARNPFSSAMYVTWIGTPFSMYENEPVVSFNVDFSDLTMPSSVSNENW